MKNLNLIAKPNYTPPQMTFTRASTGTYTNSAGIISTAKVNQLRYEYDPTTITRINLCTYSEQLDNAAWTMFNMLAFGSGSVANSTGTTAPDGTTNAEKIIEDNTSNYHYFKCPVVPVLNGSQYTYSIFIKPAGKSLFHIQGQTAGFGGSNYCAYDLSNGTVTNGGNYIGTITAYPNGWYRCSATMTCISTGSYFINVYFDPFSSYQGDGVSGAYFWGAQVEVGSSPTEYISTTSAARTVSNSSLVGRGWLFEESRTNYLTYSNSIANWSLVNGSASTGSSTMPDGTASANTLVINSSTGQHQVYTAATVPASSNTAVSIWLKMGAGRHAFFTTSDGTGAGMSTAVDLQTGALGALGIGGTVTNPSYSITSYPSGWYRLSLVGTMLGTIRYIGVAFANSLSDYLSQPTITGNGTDYFYVFGGQIEVGNFATSYIPTTSTTITRSADVASVNLSGLISNNYSVFSEYSFNGFNSPSTVSAQIISSFVNTTASLNLYRLSVTGSMCFISTKTLQSPVVGQTYKMSANITKTGQFTVFDNSYSFWGNTLATNVPPAIVYIGSQNSNGWMNGCISRFVVGKPLSSSKALEMCKPSTYEMPVPTLNLTAKDGVTPSQLTVTRASTATYTDAQGIVKIALTNQLRHDYDISKMNIVTNLLLQSQTANVSPWQAWNDSIIADSTYAPDGTLTADTFVDNSSGGFSYYQQDISIPIDSSTYTFSIYLKQLTVGVYPLLAIGINGGSAVNNQAGCELITGTGWATLGVPKYNSTYVGNGWWRCWISVTNNNTAGNNKLSIYIFPGACKTIGGASDGTAVGSVYGWGAQVERGVTKPSIYVPTTTSSASTIIALNDSYKGWLIEESRTNLLLYSEQADNASYWWLQSGGTITPNAITSPDGNITSDLYLESAAASAHKYCQTVSGTSSTLPYTFSIFVKPAGRNDAQLYLTNVNGSNGCIFSFNLITGKVWSTSGTIGGATGISYGSIPYPNGWQRLWVSAANIGETNVFSCLLICDSTGSNTYTPDATKGLYIWGAQLEQGSFPTSYIPTTSAAVTRSADIVSMPVNSFNYNANEGTLFAESDIGGNNNTAAFTANLSDGTTNNIIGMDMTGGTNTYGVLWTGGTSQGSMSIGSINLGVPFKAVIAYKQNNSTSDLSGSLPATNASCSIPNVNTLSIGYAYSHNNYWINGHIKRIMYWSKRLSNSILQKITR